MGLFDFDSNPPAAYTRRSFLGNGLVMASAAATVPAFLQRSAMAMLAPRAWPIQLQFMLRCSHSSQLAAAIITT